jgi:hypothetical protein
MSWSPERESNSRPTHYECVALPTELSGRARSAGRDVIGGPGRSRRRICGRSCERVASVPRAARRVGLEAGEHLLGVPVLGPRATHHLDVIGHRVREISAAPSDSHRLKVAREPTGVSPIPTTSTSPVPGAVRRRRPRSRPRRRATTCDETFARVMIATGPSAVRRRAPPADRRPSTSRGRRSSGAGRASSPRRHASDVRCGCRRGTSPGRVPPPTRRNTALRDRSAPRPVSSPLPVPSSRQNARPGTRARRSRSTPSRPSTIGTFHVGSSIRWNDAMRPMYRPCCHRWVPRRQSRSLSVI